MKLLVFSWNFRNKQKICESKVVYIKKGKNTFDLVALTFFFLIQGFKCEMYKKNIESLTSPPLSYVTSW